MVLKQGGLVGKFLFFLDSALFGGELSKGLYISYTYTTYRGIN